MKEVHGTEKEPGEDRFDSLADHGNSVHFCQLLFHGFFLLVLERSLLWKVTDKAVSEQIFFFLRACKSHKSSISNVSQG